MTTYLGKSCSFCLPRVPFVDCRQFMYLVISLLVLRAGYGIWLYQFLIIAYLFTLHDLHNDYPLTPEKLTIQDDWLSPFCKNLKKNKLASDKTTKLIPTLFNKEKYVLHVRNLSFYKDLGMKLTKIHRVLQFNESPWLAKYIGFNTKKRKE